MEGLNMFSSLLSTHAVEYTQPTMQRVLGDPSKSKSGRDIVLWSVHRVTPPVCPVFLGCNVYLSRS